MSDRCYKIISECAKHARAAGVSTEYMMARVIEGLEARMPRMRRADSREVEIRERPAITDEWIETGREDA